MDSNARCQSLLYNKKEQGQGTVDKTRCGVGASREEVWHALKESENHGRHTRLACEAEGSREQDWRCRRR